MHTTFIEVSVSRLWQEALRLTEHISFELETEYLAANNRVMQLTFKSRGQIMWVLLVVKPLYKGIVTRSRCGSSLITLLYTNFLLRGLVPSTSRISLNHEAWFTGHEHTAWHTRRLHKMLLHLASCLGLTTGLWGPWRLEISVCEKAASESQSFQLQWCCISGACLTGSSCQHGCRCRLQALSLHCLDTAAVCFRRQAPGAAAFSALCTPISSLWLLTERLWSKMLLYLSFFY